MRQAISEYNEILKLSGKWVTKHWKGYIVFVLICWFCGFGSVMWFDDIKDFIENKLKKSKEES